MSKSHQQRVIDYYDATHIDYRVLWVGDENRAVHFGYYDLSARDHQSALAQMNYVLARAVDITEKDNILDAGCGYGGSAMWLAKQYGCHITGITLSPLQAAKGQRYVRERQLQDNVQIMQGDYTVLPFEDDTFDVYWALESLVHADDRNKVLREACRVLRPGGRLVIAEYTLREEPALTGQEKEYLRPWLYNWAMPQLLTKSDFTKILSENRFLEIKIQDVTDHVKPSLRRLEILSMLNYPIALFIAPLFFRKERLENYYGSWRQIKALKKGLWQYTIITASKQNNSI